MDGQETSKFDPTIAFPYSPGELVRYRTLIASALPTYDHIFQMSKTFLESALPEEARVLVLQCGNIRELEVLAQAHPRWVFTGIDQSPELLNSVRSETKSLIPNGLINLIQGSTDEIPVDRPFDAATCILLLHLIPDDDSKLALLKRIAKSLKPQSTFILVSLTGDHQEPEFARQLDAWKLHISQKKSMAAVEADEFARIIESLPVTTQGRLMELMKDAGFDQPTLFYATYQCRGWVSRRA